MHGENMEDESFMRTSLDNQIKEAKTRAELFSKSLHDARAQEAIALKILEEERERWAHSFEEKSIMIEQLERELTSTVEALDVERSIDKISLPKYADLKVFSNEEVDQTFHELMEDVNARLPTFRKTMEVLDTSRVDFGNQNALPMQRTVPENHISQVRYQHKGRYNENVYNQSHNVGAHLREKIPQYIDVDDQCSGSGAARYVHDREPGRDLHSSFERTPLLRPHHITNEASLPSRIKQQHDHQNDSLHASQQYQQHQQQQHQPQHPPAQSTPLPSVSAPIPPTTTAEDLSVWRDLLSQYQEQLKLVKIEKETAVDEKERLSRLTLRLEQQVKLLTEEKELFATACENAEGKLKFRVAQVLEYERDKESQNKRIAELSALNGELQTQMTSLRQELLVANTELRVHSSRNKNDTNATLTVQTLNGVTAKTTQELDSMSFQKENAVMRDQQVFAAEGRVQDLSKQLSEAHGSYRIQLDEAQKIASSLQMLLKDAERRCDDFRSRAHLGEQAAAQFKAERDALLTMVSKLHLTPQSTVLSQQQYEQPQLSTCDASTAVRSSFPADAAQASRNREAGALVQAPVTASSNVHVSASQSHDAHHDRHVHHQLHPPSSQHAPVPATVQGIAVVPFLSRSVEDAPLRAPVPSISQMEPPSAVSQDFDHSLESSSDEESADVTYSGSESEVEEDEEEEEGGGVLHPESATGSVLDVTDRVHSHSLGHPRELPAAAKEESRGPSATVSHSGRQRVSLHGMLAASVDTVTSHGKKKKKELAHSTFTPTSSRATRSRSKESNVSAQQKSNNKTLANSATAAAATGQPGKSMVIRKPPSYTGASIEVLRGTPRSSPEEVRSHAKGKPAAKISKKPATGPSSRTNGLKGTKKQNLGDSVDNTAIGRHISPVDVANSVDYKNFVPPSYSNRNYIEPNILEDNNHIDAAHEHDVSWESEVSRADTSALSHEVNDFAEADAHFEQHGTDVEEGETEQSHRLDAAGLTVGLMGFAPVPQPPTQQPVPNHRYQEAHRGDALRDSVEDAFPLNKDVVLGGQEEVHSELPPGRLSSSLDQGRQGLRRSQESAEEYRVASQSMRSRLEDNARDIPQEANGAQDLQPFGPRARSNSLNSASVVSTHSDDQSSRRASGLKSKQPRIKYSGITDIKISHKLKPGDIQPVHLTPSVGGNAATRKVPPGASRSLRTPSPMTRTAGLKGSASSSAKRMHSTPQSLRPASSVAAVVTPGTGTSHSKGRIIASGSSVLKKSQKDRYVSSSASRRQSLMY